MYNFVRSLETVLEWGDLNEILIEQETTIVKSCSKWLNELEMEHADEMINYFDTFNNNARFKRPITQMSESSVQQNGQQNGDLEQVYKGLQICAVS